MATALVDTPQIVTVPDDPSELRWSAPVRVAFRFCFVYFGLYVLTTQMLGGLIALPNWQMPDPESLPPIRNVVSWTAVHVFRVTHPLVITGSGSGDKTLDWVAAFCLLAIAVVATTAWSAVDRARANYVAPHKWFRLFLRFATGSTMVGYGTTKLIPLQMPFPYLMRLVEPFGNFSPMGVLWASIGASPAYQRFAGCAELAAAALLFIPRTATLGALVLLADAIQIFTLNMTYDIPVKLFAFHLILMSIVLIAPDARRLLNVLIFNRTAPPSSQPPLVHGPRGRRILVAAQILFGAYLIGIGLADALQSWTRGGGGAPKPALYGIWNVEKMSVDGVERAPLVTDYDRWRRVVFQFATVMMFQRMDDSFAGYPAKIDIEGRTIVLTKRADKAWTARFAFQRAAADRLTLDGTMDGHRVQMQLKLFDRSRFLLVSRGFNWIQEYPFNR